MKSKYFMILAIAFLAQEATALPHISNHVSKNEMPQHKVPEEATVSDFGLHITLTHLVFLFLEDGPGAVTCYGKEQANYTKIIHKYINGMKRAAIKLKNGPPKAQSKIEHAMAKFPIKLEKHLYWKNYEKFEEFMWDFSGDISIWDYQIHKDIKKMIMSNSNKMDLTNYVKELFNIRKRTEEECKKIIDRITNCMEEIESNF